MAVKKNGALRGEASNAVNEVPKSKAPAPVKKLRKEKIYLAVHRLENVLYYKRLEPEAFQLLSSLSRGATILKAISEIVPQDSSLQFQSTLSENIQSWFKIWTQLGWFCKRK